MKSSSISFLESFTENLDSSLDGDGFNIFSETGSLQAALLFLRFHGFTGETFSTSVLRFSLDSMLFFHKHRLCDLIPHCLQIRHDLYPELLDPFFFLAGTASRRFHPGALEMTLTPPLQAREREIVETLRSLYSRRSILVVVGVAVHISPRYTIDRCTLVFFKSINLLSPDLKIYLPETFTGCVFVFFFLFFWFIVNGKAKALCYKLIYTA